MNLIDKLLSHLDNLSASEIIESLGWIYDEPISRELLSDQPLFIQDIIFLIDLDTELNMSGVDSLFESSTALYIPQMISALRRIGAEHDAGILEKLHAMHELNPEDLTQHELANSLYLYEDRDIWGLLETYVDREKNKQDNL